MDETEEGKVVRLADNIRQEEEDGQTVYTYDEVLFTMDPDRTETAEDIAEDFDAWWEFGSQPEEPEPTLEDRVSAIEEFLIGGDL
jgi:hypothetical protein